MPQINRCFALCFVYLFLSYPYLVKAQCFHDIVIAYNEATSMTAQNYQDEKDFIETLLLTGSSSSNPETRYTLMEYNENQNIFQATFSSDYTQLVSNLDNQTQAGGSSGVLAALTASVDLFANQSTAQSAKTLILMAQNFFPSNQNPCSNPSLLDTLDNENIYVLVIGLGSSFDPNIYTCLVDDENTQIVAINNYSAINSFPTFDNADLDDLPDFCDDCPNDAMNDTDQDGLCFLEDPCPDDPLNDEDDDGICFAQDLCPNDPTNTCEESDAPSQPRPKKSGGCQSQSTSFLLFLIVLLVLRSAKTQKQKA